MSFSWEDTPLHWGPGDPFTTHTINVLHLLLPAGERWFVHVYKQALPHLRKLGLDPTPYTAQVDWLFEKLLGDRTLPPGRARTWWLVEWRLLYCGRARASMPFLEEVEKLDRVTVVEGRPDLDALLADVPEGGAVYCCGPEGLMAAVEERFPKVRLERFTPRAATGSAFEVELRCSGRTLTVPADSSVLAAVREELPNTAYSCEQGFCGTCQQRVLEGEVEHRDELLTDAERADSMLICVSRARSERLVLDM